MNLMADPVAESGEAIAVATPPQGRTRWSISSVVPYLAVILICSIVLARIYHLTTIDFRVPLGFASDNLFYQALIKNFVSTGHYYVNPLLGAPGQQELYDFPMPHWIHLIVLAFVRIITSNAGIAINLFYLLGYLLSAVTTLYAFRKLGISAGLATAGALLFVFLPYHLWRAEGHLFLSSYYIVPLMAMVAVWLGTGTELFTFGRGHRKDLRGVITRDGLISIAACVLISLDNPYYAFYGAYLILVGGLLGALRHRFKSALLATAVLLAVLVSTSVLALLPNAYYVHKHGRTAVAARLPVESEMFSLTVIQMLAPVTNHRIPSLAEWKQYYNRNALLVNENDSAALGVVGSVGFLALLICLFVRRCDPRLYALSILSLFATLLGTMGGFGAIVGFVLTPQLRGFNRISVYIGFFSIAAVLILLDRLGKTRFGVKHGLLTLIVIPVALLAIGIPDQVAKHQTANRAEVEKLFWQDAGFVKQIESIVPPHSMIFQLPYDPFPEMPPMNAMGDYDELKGYLHSDVLRWSYGAMKGRPTDHWLATVSAQPIRGMLLTIADAGFAGLYIDRNGYADRAAILEAQLKALLGNEPVVGEGGRLSFFVIDQAAIAHLKRPLNAAEQASLDNLLHPITAEAENGCWPEEQNSAKSWHWCGRSGEIVLTNPSNTERQIAIEANLVSAYKTPSSVWINGPSYNRKLEINNAGTAWKAEVSLMPGISVFNLVCGDCKRVVAQDDPRAMFFHIDNFHYHDIAKP
jgi:phosphoglycerol transferase